MRFSLPHRRRRVFSFFDFRSSFSRFSDFIEASRGKKNKTREPSFKLVPVPSAGVLLGQQHGLSGRPRELDVLAGLRVAEVVGADALLRRVVGLELRAPVPGPFNSKITTGGNGGGPFSIQRTNLISLSFIFFQVIMFLIIFAKSYRIISNVLIYVFIFSFLLVF